MSIKKSATTFGQSLAKIKPIQANAPEIAGKADASAGQLGGEDVPDMGLDIAGPKKFGLAIFFAVFENLF